MIFAIFMLILMFALGYWYITIPLIALCLVHWAAHKKEKQHQEQLEQQQTNYTPELEFPIVNRETQNRKATFVFHNGQWYQLATYQQVRTVQRWELVQ